MNICEEYAALLDPYVDGELTAEEMLRVQEHLDGCPACRAYVDDALAIRAAFPGVEDTEVPEGFAEAVSAAIRAGAAPQKRRRPWWARSLAPLAACCAVVILLARMPLALRDGSGNLAAAAPESVETESTADTALPQETPQDDAVPEEKDEARPFQDLPETASSGAMFTGKDGAEQDWAQNPEPDSYSGLEEGGSLTEIQGKDVKVRNQPETESAPAPQMMEAPPPTAWIPAAQEDLLAGYDRNTGDGGEPFWLLTAEEYGALLEALAERDAAPTPDSPPAEEVTEEIRICLREV